MNIDYTHISPHHQEVLVPTVESFKHLFPSWVDRVTLYYDEETQGGASASPYKPYRRVAINVSKELLSEPQDKIDIYIAHEIAHCYNEGILRFLHEYIPLLSIEDETRKVIYKAGIDVVEEQTEDLAILFCREDSDE